MLKKSAEGGSTQAMNALAYVLLHGQGVEVNLKESLRYSEMAANQGHIDAMSNFASLGLLHPELNRTADAVHWLKKALNRSGSFAYYLSGYLLAHNHVTLEKLGMTCEDYVIESFNIVAKLIMQENSEEAYHLFTNGKHDESAIRLAYGLYSGNVKDTKS